MRTPAEIADAILTNRYPLMHSGLAFYQDAFTMIQDAIEADRAQLVGSIESARDEINATYQAAEGDSNDDEIEALQGVRDSYERIVSAVGGAWEFEPGDEDDDE